MIEQNASTSSASFAAGNQVRDFPLATYSLVALNIILYIGSIPGDKTDLAIRYGLIPERLEFLRLFTTFFLHFDAAHLVVNMLFLWLFGRKVEKAMGPVMFLLFYIGSGFIASLLHVLITAAFLSPELQSVPIVGASGAVAGVLGMYAIRFNRERIAIGSACVPAIYLLLFWFMIQVGFGILGIFVTSVGSIYINSIGYWSHIGGFVFGMTAAWVTIIGSNSQPQSKLRLDELKRKTLIDVAEQFRSLNEADPSDPFAHAELGRVRALLGDQARSTANYMTAIGLYKKSGQKDEALACLKDALRFWPESTLAHDTVFRFACFYESLGASNEAADRFKWLSGAARGKPEAEMALIKLAQIQLGRFNQPEQAKETVELLMKEYPNSKWIDIAEQILSRTKH